MILKNFMRNGFRDGWENKEFQFKAMQNQVKMNIFYRNNNKKTLLTLKKKKTKKKKQKKKKNQKHS